MNGSESLFTKINEILINQDRTAFIKNIKDVENEFHKFMQMESGASWHPGLGLKTVNLLSRFRDKVINKVIEFIGGVPEQISVIAVGGYGRGELSPFSDIDLLILHSENAPIESFAHEFLTLLWDCDYKIGSSVRTLENLSGHARVDIEFMTSLFEARFLKGDEDLYKSMESLLKKIISSIRLNYLRSQMEEFYKLIRDSGNEILLKEPDIKSSIGGLRSVHLMEWLNYAFTFQAGLAGLEKSLPHMYYKRTYAAYDFLLYIRNILHFKSERKNDHFLIDDQFFVSEQLGIRGAGEEKAKRLMKKYYDKSLDIFLSLLYIIDDFHLRFIRGVKSKKGNWGRKLERHFIIYNKRLYVREGAGISVENAFQAVYLCCRAGCMFTFSLIHYVRECAKLMNDETRKSKEVFNYFRKILALNNSALALSIMKLSGMLYVYLTPFKKIKHLIIYNPYHQFTVDQHAIEAVQALESLNFTERDPKKNMKFRHFIQVYNFYKKNTWLIKLAILFHDIGKAYEGDHSKNGVKMADELLTILPVKPMARGLILFLIDNHLLFANLTRRNNIADASLLQDLAGRFIMTPFPQEYFDSLYLMTYCDIYATKPSNFKSYTAELLTLLYRNTLPFLGGKAARVRSKGRRNEIVKTLLDNRKKEISEFIKEMGPSYSFQNQEKEILFDYETIQNIRYDEFSLKVRGYNDYFKVKIFGPDRKGLFAFFCGVLALNGADIVRAEINTYKGIAVDEFTVTRIFGVDFMDHMKDELNLWREDLAALLKKYQNQWEQLEDAIEIMKMRMKKPPLVFHREAAVSFEEKRELLYTMEITGMDRPALLFDAAGFLTKSGFEILSAHIDTMGWYVHDIFVLRSPVRINTGNMEEIRASVGKILESRF